jgi:hypothetical protein
MLRTAEKAILITCCVAGIVLAFLLWNPYAKISSLNLEYVKGQAIKWARCIEERTSFAPDVPALVSQDLVNITVVLPNEQLPLTVLAKKSRLRIPCSEASGGVLVYGPPITWSGERKAKVYQEEGYVVVELVPRVQITTSYESGTNVHVVRVELFHLDLSQVEARKAIGPKSVQELTYARGYDKENTGEYRVLLNGVEVTSPERLINGGECVRVVIAYELWS